MNNLNFNLNRSLFEKKEYDSKYISTLQSLHHRFTEEGHYSCNIFNSNKLIKTFVIMVERDCKTLKNNFDISEILRDKSDHYTVSINEYVGFYVSNGSLQVTITIYNTKDRKELAFDSSNLRMHDVFCASFLKPGKYIVENKLISARMTVDVLPFDKRPVSPKKVEVLDKFDSDKVELMQTETLFLIIKNEKDNQITIKYLGDGSKENELKY